MPFNDVTVDNIQCRERARTANVGRDGIRTSNVPRIPEYYQWVAVWQKLQTRCTILIVSDRIASEENPGTDLEVFQKLRAGLLAQHEGKYALIHNGELIGIYDSMDAAYIIAVDKFGADPVYRLPFPAAEI